MGMTISEKILAAHCGKDKVVPGEIIMADVDIALGNDITAPLAIKEFEKAGAADVFDKEKVALVPDHFTPNKDIKSAEQAKILRNFAKKHDLKYYWDQGEVGVEHCLLPQEGVVVPGDVIVGADSHTCTYGALGAFATGVGSTDLAAVMITGKVWFKVPQTIKFIYTGKRRKWVGGKDLVLYTIGDIGVDGALYAAMEFTGDAIDGLPMADRMTMSNMAIEAGGKAGIIVPDDITIDYVNGRAQRPYQLYNSDPDAEYARVIEYNMDSIEPQVAFPFLPSNTRGISEVGEVIVDQAVIGSCTNGRIEDMRVAAEILKGKKVAKSTRTLIIPGTREVYLQMEQERLIGLFVQAGAIVSPPTCGPCLGGHMGILAEGERCISTTNRNFVGRMGHIKSEVYLANPAIAAASALTGKITDPEEVM